MTARIIDGKAIAASVRETCRLRARELRSKTGTGPGLAVILVGSDPASVVYVRSKLRACSEAGIESTCFEFSKEIETDTLLESIERLNASQHIHGILVQLPLPPHIDIRRVLGAISQDKDVDGFHLYNIGALVVGHPPFAPCTPFGVMRMLEHEKIEVEGKNIVVVGASNIVGKPMALMLMQREATVSICHAKTRDLAQYTILADILVVAVGKPHLITAPMVRTGAVIIDVGINRLPTGALVGDVDFEGVKLKASYITPVPGGVGPMTVAMLLDNTVSSAERAAHSVQCMRRDCVG